MEKGKMASTCKVSWSNIIGIVVLLGSLLACNAPHGDKKSTLNENSESGNTEPEMSEHVIDTGGLLTKIIDLNRSRIGRTEQIMLVTNRAISMKDVTIQLFEKKNDQWGRVFPGFHGSIGHNGFSPYQKKREGDKTSPTGIYDLGLVFGYAGKVDTKMEYRQATRHDFWIDDPASDDYNKWVTREKPPAVSHEKMKLDNDLYKLGIVVEYNTEPVVKGHGSAIFVHIEHSPGSPTAGCVALPETDLERIVRWLDPDKHPLIIMGTEEELETVAL